MQALFDILHKQMFFLYRKHIKTSIKLQLDVKVRS